MGFTILCTVSLLTLLGLLFIAIYMLFFKKPDKKCPFCGNVMEAGHLCEQLKIVLDTDRACNALKNRKPHEGTFNHKEGAV